MVESVLGWGEGGVNDPDLGWVNGHHADKAIAHAAPGVLRQSVQVSECRKDRFYGCGPRRCGAEKSERTNHFIGRCVRPIVASGSRSTNGGRQVLCTPRQTGQAVRTFWRVL